jgi:hypothetical protein
MYSRQQWTQLRPGSVYRGGPNERQLWIGCVPPVRGESAVLRLQGGLHNDTRLAEEPRFERTGERDPAVFHPVQRHWVPSLNNAISDAATHYWSMAPGMRVSVPGMAPLTIGCRDSVSGLDFRFSWPDGVPVEDARSDYEVSGTDWLTLVEKFGLAPHLVRRVEQGATPS